MAAYLCAVTADSGLPLFTKRVGDLEPLPFATVGLLNGVHMFSYLQGSELQQAVTPEEKLIWRVYRDRIVLILVTRNDGCDECHLVNILDNIFAAMAMMVGLDAVVHSGNIEKLKRELKLCSNLIEYLLNQMNKENMTMGDLTQRVDVLLSYESQALVPYLEKYLELADTAYGCLLVHGKVVLASKQWWTLPSQELVLLSALVSSLPKSASRCVPVYLPMTCPKECNRLIILQLLKGIELCALCGSIPTLQLLEEEAPKIWKGSFDLLKTVNNLHPRNLPSSVIVDQNILGILLTNKELNQTVCSLYPNDDSSLSKEEKTASLHFRQEALRTFYKTVVGKHFTEDFSSTPRIRADSPVELHNSEQTNHTKCAVKEFYLYTEKYKCYAINSPPYEIFIICIDNIPFYAIREVCQKTLKALTTKKLAQRCAAS